MVSQTNVHSQPLILIWVLQSSPRSRTALPMFNMPPWRPSVMLPTILPEPTSGGLAAISNAQRILQSESCKSIIRSATQFEGWGDRGPSEAVTDSTVSVWKGVGGTSVCGWLWTFLLGDLEVIWVGGCVMVFLLYFILWTDNLHF